MERCRRNLLLCLSTAAVALCALPLGPAEALAATASIDIKRVYYTAGTNEANDLTLSLASGNYALSDPGATISAGPGCTASEHTATCPAARTSSE